MDRGGVFWRGEMLAQLRCDVIAAEQLVIPDTHLFDGEFFMSFAPHELATALGGHRDSRLRGLALRLRNGTIRDTLANWLVREGSPTLNAFPFKLIADRSTRSEISKTLGKTPRTRWNELMSSCNSDPARALGCLLRECLGQASLTVEQIETAKTTIARAEQAWSTWLEAGDRQFHCESWDRAYDVWGAIQREPIDGDLWTEEGRALHQSGLEVLRGGSKHRADLTSLVDDVRKRIQDDRVLHDCDVLENWYSRARYRAIAEQHDCVFAYDPAGADGGGVFGTVQRVEAEEPPAGSFAAFPEGFQRAAVSVSGEQFGLALAAAQFDLKCWWGGGDFTALGKAIERIAEKLDCAGPTATHRQLQKYVHLGQAAGAAVALAVGAASVAAVVGVILGGVVIGANELAKDIHARKTRNRIVEVLGRRVLR